MYFIIFAITQVNDTSARRPNRGKVHSRSLWPPNHIGGFAIGWGKPILDIYKIKCNGSFNILAAVQAAEKEFWRRLNSDR